MRQSTAQRFVLPERVIQSVSRATTSVATILMLSLMIWLPANHAAARQGDSEFTPVKDHAQVIAQGVVEMPAGQAIWRTVRARATASSEATFDARSLGFVFASGGPLLLVDARTGEQTRLGTGEAALVREGAVQQRSSLANDAVTYLAIELVTSATSAPAGGTVLETGEPFAAPSGQHDLDLLADSLASGESLTIPDSGAENLFLVTAGTAALNAPNGDSEVLLAGESSTFVGERTVSAAPDGDAPVSFLAAIIGPAVPAPTLPPQSTGPSPVPGATSVAGSEAGQGSISLQVYACPSGMTAQKIDITACAIVDEGFAITVTGPALARPLTLSDAESTSAGLRWGQLPPGDYEIAETELPAGATSYVLAARGSNGGRISIDSAQPDQSVRIYNFRP